MIARAAIAASPLEEVRAAIRALDEPLIPADLSRPVRQILETARGILVHPTYRVRPALSKAAVADGTLELARAVNARAVRISLTRNPVPIAADPIAVAQAVHDGPDDRPALAALSDLHCPQRVWVGVPGAEAPDDEYDVCAHCTELAGGEVGYPCATAIAAGLAQPPAPPLEIVYSEEAPF
ncbi:hypothetical protein [Actinocorallia longicatena]|uniref:Uncharacterized protein n=1 Tax=Actinocorallia longicatena TaxID=111803 RepID=A0ABP6QHS0_9ACTN